MQATSTASRKYADLASHPIEGYARAALERGLDGWFSVPLASHIEGNLWMGGCDSRVKLDDDFVNVLSLYPWEHYQLGPDTSRVEVRLYDSEDMASDETLASIVETALAMVQSGKTLIHCQAGLNRSGLISALVLRALGKTSEEAIALLREKRSPMVLCNQTFESYLLGLDS